MPRAECAGRLLAAGCTPQFRAVTLKPPRLRFTKIPNATRRKIYPAVPGNYAAPLSLRWRSAPENRVRVRRGTRTPKSCAAAAWRLPLHCRGRLAHSAVVTAANVHDKHPLPDLLHGNEQRVCGDSAHASQKALIRAKAPRARDFTNQRVRRSGEIDEAQRSNNRGKSRVRARVEHVFAVVKRLWGFSKVRYRGLAKNATRSFVALSLANISLARGHLA